MFAILRKFKSSKAFRVISSCVVSAIIGCMFCLTCFAAEGDSSTAASIESVLSSSFNDMSSQVLNLILIALPVVLGIVAAVFSIKKAIKFFTSLANKG